MDFVYVCKTIERIDCIKEKELPINKSAWEKIDPYVSFRVSPACFHLYNIFLHPFGNIPRFNISKSVAGLLRWLGGKESSCQGGDAGSIPGSRRISWRRKWQLTSVFLPGKSPGERSLAGSSPWGHRRVEHDLATKQQQ